VIFDGALRGGHRKSDKTGMYNLENNAFRPREEEFFLQNPALCLVVICVLQYKRYQDGARA